MASKRGVSPSECESCGGSRDASDAFKGCVVVSMAQNHCVRHLLGFSISRNINAPKSRQTYRSLWDDTHILYYTSS